jgi:CTP synthase
MHRYEVNPDMVGEFESRGLRFVGRDASGRRMEIIELADYAPQNLRAGGRPHPFFVGVQVCVCVCRGVCVGV